MDAIGDQPSSKNLKQELGGWHIGTQECGDAGGVGQKHYAEHNAAGRIGFHNVVQGDHNFPFMYTWLT